MKKKILYALAFAACLVSCSEYEESVVAPEATVKEGDALSFTTSIEGTRVTDSAFEAGDQVSVAAIVTANDVVRNSNSLYEYGSGALSSADENPITALTAEQEMAFYATYPAQDAASIVEPFTFTVEADQSAADGIEMSDLLVASVTAAANSNPELTFSHVMSSVRLAVSSSMFDLAEAVVTVNAVPSIECDILNGTYVASGDATAITAACVAVEDGVYTYEAIIAPQTIIGAFITVEVDGKSATWGDIDDVDVVGRVFDAGAQYDYTFNLDAGLIAPIEAVAVNSVTAGYQAVSLSWTASDDDRCSGYKIVVGGDTANAIEVAGDKSTTSATVDVTTTGSRTFAVMAVGSDDSLGDVISLSTTSDATTVYVYGSSDIVAYPVTTAAYDGTDASFVWGTSSVEGATISVACSSGSSVESFDSAFVVNGIADGDEITLTTTYVFDIVGSAGQPAAVDATYKAAVSGVADPGTLATTFADVKTYFSSFDYAAGESVPANYTSYYASRIWDGNVFDGTCYSSYLNTGFLRTITIDLGAEYNLETFTFWNKNASRTQTDHALQYFKMWGASADAGDPTTTSGLADGYEETRYVTSDEITYYATMMLDTPDDSTVAKGVDEATYGETAEYLIPDFEGMGTDKWYPLLGESQVTYISDSDEASAAAEAGYTFNIDANYTSGSPVRYVRIQFLKAWKRGTQYYEIGEIDFTGSMANGTTYSLDLQ